MQMTEHQRFRIEIAAQILSAKLQDSVLAANRESLTAPTKLLIDGALHIAEELIQSGMR